MEGREAGLTEAAQLHSTHRFVLETRGAVSVLICKDCQRPFLDIVDGQIRLKSKHGSVEHENFLTIDHLRMLAVEMYRQTHPPERW